MPVPARLSVVTLGVADVEAATAFYTALGFPRSGASVPGDVTFFRLAGSVLAVWGRDDLTADTAADTAADTGLDPGPAGFRGVTTAINVDTAADVDAVLEQAVAVGGTLLRAARTAEWGGRTGYFADPDGHVWEVAHNPGWPIDEHGTPRLPA